MTVSETSVRLPERVVPTRWGALVFQLKVNVFRAQRFAAEFGRGPARQARGDAAAFPVVVAEARSALWSDPRASERALQWGKVHNLRAAARLLDRTLLGEGQVFSFWRQMGRASGRRGFTTGRMLQGGCLVPATGGGLCQLSKALYEVALDADCTIVERHGHSRRVPGSRTTEGRDATVAWNYVDLRFAAKRPMLLRVIVEKDELVVRLTSPPPRGEAENSRRGFSGGGAELGDLPPPEALRASIPQHVRDRLSPQGGGEGTANDCGSCEQVDCFRREGHAQALAGRRAFVVDENWSELRAWVARERKDGDVLALPLDGARWRATRYAWETKGFAHVAPATLTTLTRSLRLRFAKDGPEKRKAELRGAERLAARLSRALVPDVTDVVVAQSLLPHLWRSGHLGGRRFTVLMTRMPMAEIQARLNLAATRHRERRTLADFRADPALVTAETEALAAAERIVTPHTEIAALFGARGVLLDWIRPMPLTRIMAPAAKRVAFVGPTIARKGAFELRAAAKALDLEIVPLGGALEGADFWSGVRTALPDPANWLNGVAAVVQPALLEDAPRKLLAALAAGVPVIATPACGLPEQVGVTLVPADDADALIAALGPFA